MGGAEHNGTVTHLPITDMDGRSLVNLVAELEHRMTGSSTAARMERDLGALVPEGESYVLFLFDGLGAAQAREAEGVFAMATAATLTAPFPSTTTVALSTVATGAWPRQHGIIGHHMWWPDLEAVVNVLKWIYPGGAPTGVDTGGILPAPNLWERLRAAGVEPITVQPAAFEDTPLTRMLYRGCRIEPATTLADLVDATVQLVSGPRRLVFSYLPHIDIAAHISGRGSDAHRRAVSEAESAWTHIADRLPPTAALVGTADHGHIDYRPDQKTMVDRPGDGHLFGDPRALYLRGDGPDFVRRWGGRWHPVDEMKEWLGPGPDHPALAERLPDGVVLADEGRVLIPSNMDRRLVGYHGGWDDDERLIPLLVAT